jgi:hypothetical protein
MRINYGVLVMEIVAIFASYLILFLPITAATNINIYFGSWKQVSTIDPDSEVISSVTKDSGDSYTVSIRNATSRKIKQVVVYKCKNTDPGACVTATIPETFTGNMMKSYNWDQIADTSAALPQTGYLVILIELEGTVNTWYGLRYRLRKTVYGHDPVYSWDIGNVDVYAQTSSMVGKIKSFIDNNGMIPFNPVWTSTVRIGGTNGLMEIFSNTPPTGFSANVETGDMLTGLSSTYSLAFPQVSAEYFNAITFYNNPSYTCGNAVCESVLGETSASCCLDCPCTSSYQYCEAGAGACMNENLISLVQVGQQQTGITNCYQQHTINIHVKINSAPSDATVIGQYYTLGGQPAQTTICTLSSGVYDCPVTVPADPSCSGSSYNLGPNMIIFTISYMNGTTLKTKDVSTSFPDVTVGSWTCGNGACETGLGESDGNCCYDCGCPGHSQYCDFAGDYSLVQCRQEVTNNDLNILNINPTYFYTQPVGGARINFDAKISNRPAGMTSIVPSCSAACVADSGVSCSSSCSVLCSTVGTDPLIHEDACSMTFHISNYNQTERYSLYPTLMYSMDYNNASGSVAASLSSAFTTVTVDKHWCGDGVCNPNEGTSSCCFDCACPTGQYCDTQNTGSFTPGDTCKAFDAVSASIVPPPITAFDDSMFTHTMYIDAYVLNAPSDAVMVPDCSFASGDPGVPCSVSCGVIDNTGYSQCTITVPSIDYTASSYFNSANNRILLTNNRLNLSVSFSNGSRTTNKLFVFNLPDITINVTYHCGMGGCEASLGETVDNCCIDCGCRNTNEYCYTGGYLAGQCLDSDQLYLIFDDIFPKPFDCTITQVGDDCVFTRSLGIKAHIPNQPDDLQVIAASYESRGKSWNANCIESNTNVGNYTCYVVLENIKDSTEGNQIVDGTLSFSVSYTTNGTDTVKNLTAQFAVDVTRVKSEYVKSCEAQIAKLDDQLDGLEKNEKTIQTILYVFIGVTIGMCIACIWYSWACTVCEWGICLTACISGILLPMMQDVEMKIEDVKMQRQATCATGDFGGLSSSNSASFDTGNLYITIAVAIVCLVCMLTNFGDGSTMKGLTGHSGTTSAPPGVPADYGPGMARGTATPQSSFTPTASTPKPGTGG